MNPLEKQSSSLPLLAISLSGSAAAIILTLWFAVFEINGFQDRQLQAMKSEAGLANGLVGKFVHDRQNLVRAFANHNTEQIKIIGDSDNDDELSEELRQRIKAFFPSFFSFVVRNAKGGFVPDNFGELVGDFCRRDMTTF